MKNFTPMLLLLGCFFLTKNSFAQSTTATTLEETILKLDAQFWNVYNTCEVDSFKKFLTDDLEFYHDKGGLTETSDKLVTMIKNGLCADPKMKLRREAVQGTINVFPLNNYGAIITGEHLFYLTENDKPERLVEAAKFTHVWKNENGVWRMSRVLSYDHQQANSNTDKETKTLSAAAMQSLIGTYKAPKTGTVKIFMENTSLRIKAGPMNAELFATSDTSLYIKEAPVRFEFEKDTNGKVVKFTVFENGTAVEEVVRVE
jgi:hypothetical protein